MTSKTCTIFIYREPYSSLEEGSVDLSGLEVSEGTLAPEFSSSVTGYSVTLANSVDSISIAPKARDSEAVIYVNSSVILSGTASAPQSLSVGTNRITVSVFPSGGGEAKDYLLDVTSGRGFPNPGGQHRRR